MSFVYSTISLCSLLFLLHSTSYASDQERLQNLLELPFESLFNVEIVTASKHAEDINDTPSTVFVISQQHIRQRRYKSLVDLLQDLPGVDVHRNTRSTAYHNVSLRGHLNNSKVLILQDGVRIEPAAGDQVPIADNFPLYHVKQVEILYGPAAALYGADAFAGVINLITEDGKVLNGAQAELTYGTDNYAYFSARAGVELQNDVDLVVGTHLHSADLSPLHELYPEHFPKVDAATFDGRVKVPAAEREDYMGPISSHSMFAKLNITEHFTLGFQHNAFSALTSTGDKPSAALYREDAQWNTEVNTVYGRFRYDLSDKLSSETLWEYNHFEVLPTSKYFNIYVEFEDDGYEYAKSSKHSLEQQFTYLFSDAHTLITGLSYASYYSLPQVPDLPKPYQIGVAPEEQGHYYPNTNDSLPIVFFDTSYSNKAVYLQLQSAWLDSFSTTLGVRYDNSSEYGATWNPRLGFVYRIQPETILKMLYGEAFRAPTATEGFGTFGTFTGEQNAQGEYISNFFRSPNFDLQPEKAHSLEISLSHAFHDRLHMNLSTYYAEVDNLIVTADLDEPVQFIPGGVIKNSNQKQNVGTETRYGLDLSLNYQKKFGSITGNFWGSYSYIDGSVQDSGDDPELDLSYVSKHKFKLGSTFSYRNYFLTSKLYYIGKANTGREDRNTDDPSDLQQTPDHFLMHLHLGANDILLNLSAYLDVLNLFDARYYGAAGSASTTFVQMPQQGRSVMFSLGYKF